MIGFPVVLGAGLVAFFPLSSLLYCLPFLAELRLPFAQSNLRVFARSGHLCVLSPSNTERSRHTIPSKVPG